MKFYIGAFLADQLKDSRVEHPCPLDGEEFDHGHPCVDWLQEHFPRQLIAWRNARPDFVISPRSKYTVGLPSDDCLILEERLAERVSV